MTNLYYLILNLPLAFMHTYCIRRHYFAFVIDNRLQYQVRLKCCLLEQQMSANYASSTIICK